jgi:hypothetical protein
VSSIDKNFLNFGYPWHDDFEASEIDARGWLILQHLRAWSAWNRDPNNVFFRKVDLDRTALVGHSRGGEAITAALAFRPKVLVPCCSTTLVLLAACSGRSLVRLRQAWQFVQ